jgi:DNA-binding CsgD family transcriptional regulator
MIAEEWRDIPGYVGYYQVSNHGRIKSIQRQRNNGKGIYVQNEKILKQSFTSTGYKKVELYIDKKRTSYKVHRLVAQSFIENTDDKPFINHIDGNPKNNHVENLEWCTPQENAQHALRTGLKKCFYISRKELFQLYIVENMSPKNIAAMFNISTNPIRNLLHKYNIPVRNSGEARTKYNITKEMLNSELENKTQVELANQLGCDQSLISHYYNIFYKKET